MMTKMKKYILPLYKGKIYLEICFNSGILLGTCTYRVTYKYLMKSKQPCCSFRLSYIFNKLCKNKIHLSIA